MGVTWEQNTFITCDTDKCRAELEGHDFSKKGAIEAARLEGWAIGKTAKCPKCRAKAKGE